MILKYIFELLTDPLGLPIECYWEYIILAIINCISYKIAFRCVGDMYKDGMIRRSGSGSLFHWIIRLIFFCIIWGITYAIIAFAKWIYKNWILLSYILGAILFAVLIVIISVLIIKRIKNKTNNSKKIE